MLVLAYIILLVIVIVRALRYGKENETFTNVTVVVGMICSLVSVVYFFVKFNYILALLCIGLTVFTMFLKKIVRSFLDDYDARHQISVDVAERNQAIDDGLDDAFWNGEDRLKKKDEIGDDDFDNFR